MLFHNGYALAGVEADVEAAEAVFRHHHRLGLLRELYVFKQVFGDVYVLRSAFTAPSGGADDAFLHLSVLHLDACVHVAVAGEGERVVLPFYRRRVAEEYIVIPVEKQGLVEGVDIVARCRVEPRPAHHGLLIDLEMLGEVAYLRRRFLKEGQGLVPLSVGCHRRRYPAGIPGTETASELVHVPGGNA